MGFPDERCGDPKQALQKITLLLGDRDRSMVQVHSVSNLSCLARFPVTRPLLQQRSEIMINSTPDNSFVLIYDSDDSSLDFAVNVLPSLLNDPALADLPVMLINGRSDSEGACEGLAAGADDIITKPFDLDVLVAKIRRALARARALRELRQDNATLDARVTERAIQLGEVRAALEISEVERKRLASASRVPD
jgi:CheY-like chemotaxis protein